MVQKVDSTTNDCVFEQPNVLVTVKLIVAGKVVKDNVDALSVAALVPTTPLVAAFVHS